MKGMIFPMRMTKKVTSLVLAVLMVVSMMAVMAVSVSAATTHNVANETEFVDAVNNAEKGDTIKITADFELNQVVNFDKKLTVDFGTYTIKTNVNRAIHITADIKPDNTSTTTAYDWVTFKGTTGGLTASGDYGLLSVDGYITISGGVYNSMNMIDDGLSAVKVNAGGTLNMQGGEINATYYGIYVHGANSLVWIQGGTVHAVEDAAISGNGLPANKGYEMNIAGGTLISDNGSAIYHPNEGKLKIYPGNRYATVTIQGKTGIYTKAGTTSIQTATGSENKVKIIGTGDKASYEYNGNGNNPTGDAIVIDNCAYPAGGPTVVIDGGTFTSNNAQAVASYVKQDDPTYSGDNQARVENFIKKGKFNTTFSPEYAAGDKICVSDGNGNFTVGQDADNNPLNSLEAVGPVTADNNQFHINSDYLAGTLLGVQKKNDIADADVTSENGEQEAVDGDDIRFIAVIDRVLLENSTDYGFILGKVNSNRNYGDTNINKLVEGAATGIKKISAKGTWNTVCGAANDENAKKYGDPTDGTTNYKYVTCAVNGMSADDMVVARFYVVKDGKTYYAKYAGHNYQYTGCMTKADLAPVSD